MRPVPHRRGSDVTVFAVDDRSAQVLWRDLPAGPLDLEVLDDDRTIVHAVVDVAGSDAPGSYVIDGLPAATALTVVARPGDAAPRRLPVQTAARLPGEELSRFATISDLHLGERGFGHFGTIHEDPHPDGPHALRCARTAIAELTAWGAERVVVKGDVTNSGAIEQWRTYAALVDEAAVPFDALPGNHDLEHWSSSSRSISAPEAAKLFGFSMANPILVRDLPGLRVVLVDSNQPASDRGTLTLVLADILDAVAEVPQDTTVVVALHHQLHPWYGREVWPIGITHRESLDLLERLGRVHPRSLVTSGHTHRHRRWSHAGVTTTQVGSTKDYPGVWAGYVVAEGGLRQVVRRVGEPSCLAWTDRTRRAAGGAWRFIGPGPMSSRTFDLTFPT